MTDPNFKLRAGASGPVVRGTPGHVLTFGPDGQSVHGAPGGGSIPLPIPVADIDAVGVPNGYVVTATGGVAHWAPPAAGPVVFSITSFQILIGGPAEVGQTISPPFSASYSEPATSVNLSDSEGHNDPIALPGESIGSLHSFTRTAIGDSVSFDLDASGASGSASANQTYQWGALIRFGAVPDPGVYDEAFVEGLATGLTKVAPQGSYSFDCGPTDFAFWCAPSLFGLTPANFIQGVFPMAISRVTTLNVTNTFGVTLTYDVWRSDNPGLGAFNMGVI